MGSRRAFLAWEKHQQKQEEEEGQSQIDRDKTGLREEAESLSRWLERPGEQAAKCVFG